MSVILADPTDTVAPESSPDATVSETPDASQTATATVTATSTVTVAPAAPSSYALDADQFATVGIALGLVVAILAAILVSSWRRSA